MTPLIPLRRALVRLAASCTLLVVCSAAANGAAQCLVSEARGSVEIGSESSERWRPARVGDIVAPGEVVRTGTDGFAELTGERGSARLFPGSVLRLPARPVGNGQRMDLDAGSSVFDVESRGDGKGFEVHSPTVVVMVKGTRFTVFADPAHPGVAVARGLVAVRAPYGAAQEMLVRPGFAAVAAEGAAFALSLRPSESDDWEAWSRGAPALVPAQPMPRSAAAEAGRGAAAAAVHAAAQRVERIDPGAASAERARHAPASVASEHADDVVGSSGGAANSGLMGSFSSAALNGGAGSGAITVAFVTGAGGPGSDRVDINGPGISDQFNQSQVQQVMAGQTVVFSPTLLGLLATQGIDPVEFAAQLDAMFPQ